MASRYLETAQLPLDELEHFPGNARYGNIDRIAESLAVNGQYRGLVVRRHEGQHTILAGNNTKLAIVALAKMSPAELHKRYGAKIRRGIATAEALAVAAQAALDDDKTNAEAAGELELARDRAVSGERALTELGSWSGRKTTRCEVIECDELTARRINIADNRLSDIAQTDKDALAELLSYLDGDGYEGSGFDTDEVAKLIGVADEEDGGGDLPTRYEIVVECKDEADQRNVYEALTAEGRTCRVLTL